MKYKNQQNIPIWENNQSRRWLPAYWKLENKCFKDSSSLDDSGWKFRQVQTRFLCVWVHLKVCDIYSRVLPLISADSPALAASVLRVRTLMMEAVRASEASVDNRFTRQCNPEDSSEHHTRRRENLKSHTDLFLFQVIAKWKATLKLSLGSEHACRLLSMWTAASSFLNRSLQLHCKFAFICQRFLGPWCLLQTTRNFLLYPSLLMVSCMSNTLTEEKINDSEI
jgi:hypothetical protein